MSTLYVIDSTINNSAEQVLATAKKFQPMVDYMSLIDYNKVNKVPNVLFVVEVNALMEKSALVDLKDMLESRRHYCFYHPNFYTGCVVNGKHLYSIEATVEYIDCIMSSKEVTRVSDSIAYTLTKDTYKLYCHFRAWHNDCPDIFKTEQLISYLENFCLNKDMIQSAGRLAVTEKEHHFKCTKSTDFCSAGEVIDHPEDRLKYTYVSSRLYDLLVEACTEMYCTLDESIDATSNEETLRKARYEVMLDLVNKLVAVGISGLSEDEMSTLANLIELDRAMFKDICDFNGVEFQFA